MLAVSQDEIRPWSRYYDSSTVSTATSHYNDRTSFVTYKRIKQKSRAVLQACDPNDWEEILHKFEANRLKEDEDVESLDQHFAAIKRFELQEESSNSIDNSNGDQTISKSAAIELKILSCLKHPCLLAAKNVYASSSERNVIYTVLPYSCGTLKGCLGLTLPFRQMLLYQLLCGVGYIHKCRVMHRDLNPTSILVDDRYNLRLCGFGRAHRFERELPRLPNDTVGASSQCLPWSVRRSSQRQASYSPPEHVVRLTEATYHSADIWAVGCIAAEMLTKEPLFVFELNQTPADRREYIRRRLSMTRMTIERNRVVESDEDPNMLEEEIALILEMLNYDAEKRPTAEMALRSEYFAGCNYDDEYNYMLPSKYDTMQLTSLPFDPSMLDSCVLV